MSRFALVLLDAPDEAQASPTTRALGIDASADGLAGLLSLRDTFAPVVGLKVNRFEVEDVILIDRLSAPMPFVRFTDRTEERRYISTLERHNLLRIDFDPSVKSSKPEQYACEPIGVDTRTRLSVSKGGVNVYAYGAGDTVWGEHVKYETYLPWELLELWLTELPWSGEISETVRNLAGQVINNLRTDLAPILADAVEEDGPNWLGPWLRKTIEWNVLNCTAVRSLAGLPPLVQDEWHEDPHDWGVADCRECGEPCFTGPDGVVNHVDEEGDIDHDADENHVAIPPEEPDEEETGEN